MVKARGDTYEVDIWIGLCPGYNNAATFPIEKVYEICQEYVEKGLCVTVTKTKFIYTGGSEAGVCIGLINYPRFPTENREVLYDAKELAVILMKELCQFRCTIITADKTYLIENESMSEEFKDS